MCIHIHIFSSSLSLRVYARYWQPRIPTFGKLPEKELQLRFPFGSLGRFCVRKKTSAPTPHPNVRVGDKHPLGDNGYNQLRAQHPRAPMQLLFGCVMFPGKGSEYTSKQEATQDVLGKLRTEGNNGSRHKGFGR